MTLREMYVWCVVVVVVFFPSLFSHQKKLFNFTLWTARTNRINRTNNWWGAVKLFHFIPLENFKCERSKVFFFEEKKIKPIVQSICFNRKLADESERTISSAQHIIAHTWICVRIKNIIKSRLKVSEKWYNVIIKMDEFLYNDASQPSSQPASRFV